MESEKFKLLQQFADEIDLLIKKYEEVLRDDSVFSEKKAIRTRLKDLRDKIESLKNEDT